MEIIKSAGTREKFNKDKLCGSLEKAGAPADLAKKVCDLTEKNSSPGERTAKIFRTALDYLVKEDLNLAASYGLRRAIGEFGPAGFLFEQYVEIILQTYGYETKRNVMMRGACVEHEVDVSAKKDGAHYIVEAKYRNEPGIKTHIDVVMYGDARMADIARFEPRFRSIRQRCGKNKRRSRKISKTVKLGKDFFEQNTLKAAKGLLGK